MKPTWFFEAFLKLVGTVGGPTLLSNLFQRGDVTHE